MQYYFDTTLHALSQKSTERVNPPIYMSGVTLVAAPLVLGVAIYFFWRGVPIIDPRRDWLPIFPVGKLSNCFLYSLPDGLYAFALFNSFRLIWRDEMAITTLWILGLTALLILTEFLQLNHILAGTFDPLDILSYSIASGLSLLLYIPFFKPNKIHHT